MRFGIFYEHQLPRPWDGGEEEKLFQDALDQIELADRLGIDHVWEVEHHFLEEYSHSSASEVFLAAASQRTQNIRLGFGIVAVPPGYQHPARVAEKVSTLDLVSRGRVEFGTGETSSGAELEGFGVERESKRDQWEEAVDVITRMMAEEPFAGWDGKYLRMPPRNVIPKPKQKPHPPLWVACSRRETILLAAEKGMGALTFSFVDPEESKEWVDEYYGIIASEKCVPAGFAVNPNFAVVIPMMCHTDEAEAIERGIDGAHFFGYSLAHWYAFGEHRPGQTDIWEEFLRRRDETGFSRSIINADDAPLGVKIMQQGLGSLRGAIGTPDQLGDLCRRYEEAGVDQIIFVSQAGRNKHEHICESLELFATEVMPEFAERAGAAEEAKAQRMAPAMEAALARRPPARQVDQGYVIATQASGPPPHKIGTPPGRGETAGDDGGSPSRAAELAVRMQKRGEQVFRRFVSRASDQRLERLFGNDAGLRLFFAGMTSRFVPEKAEGADAEIQYELSVNGAVKHWVVRVSPQRASARAGRSEDPRLVVGATVADWVRMAAQDLEPARALMTGRLRLEGDFLFASRLGEMFGAPSPY